MGPSRISARVKADDTARIAEVTFYVDDKVVFVDREAPYQTLYDFGSVPRRTVVKAVATHTAGFTVETSVVTRELQLSYSVEVRRVVLTVTVTDAGGAPVTGLSRANFRVFEDNAAQEILEFSVEERPLRLALVLDTSGSMRGQLTQVQLAATGFLDVLLPKDLAMVVDFDDQVMLLQELTGDRDALRDALMSTFARGGTAMYDAVHATLRRLAPRKERKAIVILSDGGDTASVLDRENTLQATRAGDVLIYAIGIGGADHSVLRSISREAGGRAYFIDSAGELAGVYQQIADELRHQYILTYASTNPEYDGKWRKLKVEFAGEGDKKVRFRRGYYAVRSQQRPLDQPPVAGPPEGAVEGPPDPAESPDSGAAAEAPPAAG
jgi:Ca-activated chloride channel family protein